MSEGPGVASGTPCRLRCARALAAAAVLALGACGPGPRTPDVQPARAEWHEFQGTWTAVGSRHAIPMGATRRASIARFEGSLVLAGPSRPGAGFRAEAIVLNDSVTGMVGRAAFTDERGDQAYSELRGEGTATGNRIVGTFVGGTGRYAGATGEYEFSWRFVLEAEDGTVQGQSVGLKGRVRFDSADVPAASGSGSGASPGRPASGPGAGRSASGSDASGAQRQ